MLAKQLLNRMPLCKLDETIFSPEWYAGDQSEPTMDHRSVQGFFAEGAKIFGNNICLAVYPRPFCACPTGYGQKYFGRVDYSLLLTSAGSAR